jgi:hypothetical protein
MLYFFFVTEAAEKLVRGLFSDIFQDSLIFASKAGAYLSGASLMQHSTDKLLDLQILIRLT